MKWLIIFSVIIISLFTGLVSADTFGTGENQFTIDFVTISGDASGANGTYIGLDRPEGFVDPGYDYRIGTYEITNDQWNKFKNEYGTVTGSPPSAYHSDPTFTDTNVPTNYVSWYEAAQFVNYLNTSTGHQAAYKFTGTQGTIGYTLDIWSVTEAAGGTNLDRHKDAKYFLPTEDEWVKAAYWNDTDLQTYATIDDSIPVAGVDTNYDKVIVQPWAVGSGSEELNGTFDMMGNLWEWLEGPHEWGDYSFGSFRGIRGGSYQFSSDFFRSFSRHESYPGYGYPYIGFRVASVPEPVLIEISIDIKPQSCPNPVNVKSKGVLPVAILGSDELDVNDIDFDTVLLEGVSPIGSHYKDETSPVADGQECGCHSKKKDGYVDLSLKFKTRDLIEALGEVVDGETWMLHLTGNLKDGTPIEGTDCIVIKGKGK